MRGRPLLHSSYESDQALMNSGAKKVILTLFLLLLAFLPLQMVGESLDHLQHVLAPFVE